MVSNTIMQIINSIGDNLSFILISSKVIILFFAYNSFEVKNARQTRSCISKK
jgi:hypothetical protein